MNKKLLKQLIEAEIKAMLNEEVVEPSEQVLKGAMAYFKQQTGIMAGIPTLESRGRRTDALYYVTSLDKEIKTPVMKNLFKELSLNISVYPLSDHIGGYSFQFSFGYKHPKGGSNGLEIGTVFYYDGKYKGRF